MKRIYKYFPIFILLFLMLILWHLCRSTPPMNAVDPQYQETGTILLIPLDGRPPCRQFVIDTGHIAGLSVLSPYRVGIPVLNDHDPCGRHLGRTGMVLLLDLGSERSMGADHLDRICRVPASSSAKEESENAGMVCDHCCSCRTVHLCGCQQSDARNAFLRLIT